MVESRKVTAILVDDDELVREGIQLLLERHGLHIIGTACNGHDALKIVADLRPQIAFLDICLPILNGVELASRIRKDHRATRIIMLTGFSEPMDVVRSFRAGASGYLCKGSDLAELGLAIKAVLNGRTFISPRISNHVLQEYLKADGTRKIGTKDLTPRQRQVLQLIAEGRTSKEIANLLDVSVKAIEKYRTELMTRLNLHNIASLVMYAVKSGIIKVH